jgi:hypothetical protein
MDVQQKPLPLVIKGSDPHRPRLGERVAIPLSPEPEREECLIDEAEMRVAAIGNDEIENALARTSPHGATANVLDRRIW